MSKPPAEQSVQPPAVPSPEPAVGQPIGVDQVPDEEPSRMEHAAVVTLFFVGGALAVFGLLLWATTRDGRDVQRGFVNSVTFRTWTVVAAIAVVAFCDSIFAGINALAGNPQPPSVQGGFIERLKKWLPDLKLAIRDSWKRSWRYALCYLVFAILAVVVLLAVGKGGPDVPVEGWAVIARSLLTLGCLAACPWVLVVWMTHDQMTRTRQTLGDLPPFGGDAPTLGSATDRLDQQLRALLDDRRIIYTAVTRLLVLVLAALFMSGALRAALVAWPPTKNDLPSVDVLLYGAFFALVLGLAVIPLLRAWRNTAQKFVDQVFPPSVATTADADAARARLLARLDLNGSLFRSPIAVSSVLAPLITSLLAVFIPQVSG